MHASVGDEAEKVDVRSSLLRALERGDERGVLEEGALSDRAVYALEVLVEDPSRPDGQVPDLGVPHLPGGKADRLAGRLQRRVRIARPESVEDRRLRELDRVPRPRRRTAPAVEDDERYERESRAAVSQIAVNDPTSSEAPPTRAPSTSGCSS